ncbi:MAG: hypothetical protein GY869_03800, partial [Planctomycetes bacterium]|nr:hypothetical protein [Planctomycetota bacterium]
MEGEGYNLSDHVIVQIVDPNGFSVVRRWGDLTTTDGDYSLTWNGYNDNGSNDIFLPLWYIPDGNLDLTIDDFYVTDEGEYTIFVSVGSRIFLLYVTVDRVPPVFDFMSDLIHFLPGSPWDPHESPMSYYYHTSEEVRAILSVALVPDPQQPDVTILVYRSDPETGYPSMTEGNTIEWNGIVNQEGSVVEIGRWAPNGYYRYTIDGQDLAGNDVVTPLFDNFYLLSPLSFDLFTAEQVNDDVEIAYHVTSDAHVTVSVLAGPNAAVATIPQKRAAGDSLMLDAAHKGNMTMVQVTELTGTHRWDISFENDLFKIYRDNVSIGLYTEEDFYDLYEPAGPDDPQIKFRIVPGDTAFTNVDKFVFYTFAPGDTIEVLVNNEYTYSDIGDYNRIWEGANYNGEYPVGEGDYDFRFRAIDGLGNVARSSVRLDLIRDLAAPIIVEPYYVPVGNGGTTNDIDTVGVYTVDITSNQVGWGVDFDESDIRFYRVDEDSFLSEIGSGYPRQREDNLLFLTGYNIGNLSDGEYEIHVELRDYVVGNTRIEVIRFILDLTGPCVIQTIPADGQSWNQPLDRVQVRLSDTCAPDFIPGVGVDTTATYIALYLPGPTDDYPDSLYVESDADNLSYDPETGFYSLDVEPVLPSDGSWDGIYSLLVI